MLHQFTRLYATATAVFVKFLINAHRFTRGPTRLPGSTPCHGSKHARSPQIAAHLRRALAVPHASGSAAVAAAAPAANPRSAGLPRPCLGGSRIPLPSARKAGAQPSGTPPVPVTSARSRCISPPCPQRLTPVPCCRCRCCAPKSHKQLLACLSMKGNELCACGKSCLVT